jgi:anti-sigma regulatory factor (Ser/Thr protein kinase)
VPGIVITPKFTRRDRALSGITYDAEIRIPSNLIYLRSVRIFIRELAENMGFCREKVHNVEIATDEILSNAVEHGSEGLNSYINIYCSVDDEMMSITISDQGQGKALRKKWDEVWSEIVNNEVYVGTERGHGLLLARLLTDEMCMESNSIGGLDVCLTWFNRRNSEYCINANRVCCGPQISTNPTDE